LTTDGIELQRHGHRLQFDPDCRMACGKRADGLADSRLIHAITEAEAQPAFRRPAGATRDHRRAVGACEDVTSLLEEEPARICKFDVALRAMEKRGLQLGLEKLDLVTERGLRDVKRCRRLPEVQGLGDRRKVSQVSQFHACSSGSNNRQKLLLAAQEVLDWAWGHPQYLL
jgi:hypothetical protein